LPKISDRLSRPLMKPFATSESTILFHVILVDM